MSHNPLRTELESLVQRLKDAQSARRKLERDGKWRAAFDLASAEDQLHGAQERIDCLLAERDQLKKRLKRADGKIRDLSKRAELTWDPTCWFSAKRSKAKKNLHRYKKVRAALREKRDAVGRRLDEERKVVKKLKRDIGRAAALSEGDIGKEADRLDENISVMLVEREVLQERVEQLDALLSAPIKVLDELESELHQLEGERRDLNLQRSRLRAEVLQAQGLQDGLGRAASGRDRALIHQECERLFGVGSPGAAIHQRKRAIAAIDAKLGRLTKRISASERNCEKARRRIDATAKRGARKVVGIVIDGSNLCFEQSEFIGSRALVPLVQALVEDYQVTVVFDSSIAKRLHVAYAQGMESIARRATVHVTASRTGADETILAAASDQYLFVLSNDRFAEFRDSPVVRDDRVLRHEIINGRVMVHELGLVVAFA